MLLEPKCRGHLCLIVPLPADLKVEPWRRCRPCWGSRLRSTEKGEVLSSFSLRPHYLSASCFCLPLTLEATWQRIPRFATFLEGLRMDPRGKQNLDSKFQFPHVVSRLSLRILPHHYFKKGMKSYF